MAVGKKKVVSDHRKKSAAEEYKNKIIRWRKIGKLPKNLSVRIMKLK